MATKLQKLTFTIFDGQKCKDIYKSSGGKISEQTQLCSGGEKGRDFCVGDSGTGLMVHSRARGDVMERWRLIGVTSFGPKNCGTKGVPGVLSRVRHYIEWILDNASP